MVKYVRKKILWLKQAGVRDLCRFYYTNWTIIFVKFHPCISGGKKLSINGIVRLNIPSASHLALDDVLTIKTGLVVNPVEVVPLSVIAALGNSRILIGSNVVLVIVFL